MEKLTAFFKKLRLAKVLTVILAGFLLCVSTACNSGDVRGARPENPPVQLGGQNNPHKGGGDGYTNFKVSNDPKVKTNSSNRDHASLPFASEQLIAANSNAELLYPGAETPAGRFEKEKQLPIITDQDNAVQIPAQRQAVINRNDPDEKLLERTGNMFKEASGFLSDKADEAGARPEMKVNPRNSK